MEYANELLYKLWLAIVCKHNPELINRYIQKYGSAENIYNLNNKGKPQRSVFVSRIESAKRSLEPARQLLEDCRRKGIEVVSIDDERYPERLRQMFCPPQILYVKGTLPEFDKLVCIAIVGSRDCSDYSREFANKLSFDLAKSGALVVSGMALGVDASAHTGALSAGHITVATLAGGADVIYPKPNAMLYSQILERGAVISEQPPGTIGKGSFYSQRNRIMVGLSNGVVITEGREKSGTKITANWASEANRDVFAVPGKPCDKGAELPNKLIKDSAKLITSAEDIIEEYISVYSNELKYGIELINCDTIPKMQKSKSGILQLVAEGRVEEIQKSQKPDFEKYNEKQRIVLEYLYNNNEAVHIDDLSRECNIETTEMSFLIIELLMERAIKEYPGEYYGIL